MKFSFSSGGTQAELFLTELRRKGGSSMQKDYQFTPPPPPESGGAIGSTNTGTYCGQAITSGSQSGYATITITYRMEYTRDSNGDGTKDSDPEWVVDSVSLSDIELGVAEPPLEC